MIFKSKTLVVTMALCAIFGATANASAATDWAQHHPRRAEVNHRLAVQNARIKDEVQEGDLTKAQAQTLHAKDRTIRKQENFDASLNNGHISKAEQRALNQEENAVSKQIGQ